MYKIIGGDSEIHGPVDADGVRQWITEGRANAQTQAMGKGDTSWRALGSFPEFHNDLNAPAAGQYGYAIPPASQPMPVSQPMPGAMPMQMHMPMQPQTNGMAVASMVMGILSLLCIYPICGLPFNILGIIFGGVGIGQIKKNPLLQGKGMAVAGLVMSILSAGVILLLLILGFGAAFLNEFK